MYIITTTVQMRNFIMKIKIFKILSWSMWPARKIISSQSGAVYRKTEHSQEIQLTKKLSFTLNSVINRSCGQIVLENYIHL